MILPVPCANSDSCPLAQIVAKFVRTVEDDAGSLERTVADFLQELEAAEAWQSGDVETNEMQAIREARDWPAWLTKGAGQ